MYSVDDESSYMAIDSLTQTSLLSDQLSNQSKQCSCLVSEGTAPPRGWPQEALDFDWIRRAGPAIECVAGKRTLDDG